MKPFPVIAAGIICLTTSLYGQSKQETMDYIVRESKAVDIYANIYKDSDKSIQTTNKGVLILRLQWRDISGNLRVTVIPIAHVNYNIARSEFGYSLDATARNNAIYGIEHYLDGTFKTMQLETTITSAAGTERLEKIKKALEHLVYLETGRKELF